MLWAQLVAGTSRSGHFEYLVLGKYFPGYRNASNRAVFWKYGPTVASFCFLMTCYFLPFIDKLCVNLKKDQLGFEPGGLRLGSVFFKG